MLMEMSKIYVDYCEKLFALGVITSPNHPGNYPNNLEKTETIQVEQGLMILLEFNAFDIEESEYAKNPDYGIDEYSLYYDYDTPECVYDYLTITDGNGTTLMEKSCGSTSDGNVVIGRENIGSSLPPAIRSSSNTINLMFTTDGSTSYTGWFVSWRAVAGINHQPS